MTVPPKALIFDLDGVLVNSEPLHRRTWLEAFAEQGVQIDDRDVHQFQGRTAEQVVKWLESRPGRTQQPIDTPQLVLRKRQLYLGVIGSELEAVAGVDEFLRAQKGKFGLGLVTSSALKTVGQVMLAFNWRNIFEALVGAEHVTNPKPHPEPYLQVANRFKAHPSECLVFEDSAVGIESAVAAGARVCGVGTTLGAKELKTLGASFTIQDFRDLEALEAALSGTKPKRLFSWMGRGSR